MDDVPDDRVDVVAPAPAAEYAVVPGARLHVVGFHVGPQSGAKIVRGERLPKRADVVALTFDRQQCGAPDRPRFDRAPAPFERSLGECVVLKDAADSVELELGREVGDGEVFLVERSGRFGFLGVAFD